VAWPLRASGWCIRQALQRGLAGSPRCTAPALAPEFVPPFTSTEDLALRAQLSQQDLQALAAADALASLGGPPTPTGVGAAAQHPPCLVRGVPVHEVPLALPAAPEGEEIVFDYAATGLTLRRHPLALLRPRLARWRLQTALQLHSYPMAARCAPAASSPCASAPAPPRARCLSRWRTKPAPST
jgi:error-prone DNA polymerase